MAQLPALATVNHSKPVRYVSTTNSRAACITSLPNYNTVYISLSWRWIAVCVGHWWRWLSGTSSQALLHQWPATVLQWRHMPLCSQPWSDWYNTLHGRWNRCLVWLRGLIILAIATDCAEEVDGVWNILWPFTAAGVTVTVSCGVDFVGIHPCIT